MRLSLGMSTPRIRGILTVLRAKAPVAGPGLGLALPLLVAGVLADDVHLAPAAHDLAVFADSLDAGSDLHRFNPPPSPFGRGKRPSRHPARSGWPNWANIHGQTAPLQG